jgi:hypothetical protein
MTKRFYLDCEFDGHGGPLLSIALVGEDASYYLVTDEVAQDPWVNDHVASVFIKHRCPDYEYLVPPNKVGGFLLDWLDDHGADTHPVIVADSPVDIGYFCRAVSTDADGGWAEVFYRHMTFEVHDVESYPTDLEGAVQHNAWWDAMALRRKLGMDDDRAE